MVNSDGFINCLCTYLSFIYNLETSGKEYYLFLADKKIIKPSLLCEINENDNPWNYQPYIIGNQHLVYKGMFEQYSEFMHKKSLIKITEEKLNINNIFVGSSKFAIVPVDEFYLKTSKFFKKIHNKHYLLLLSESSKEYEVFDSEESSVFTIKKYDLYLPMHFSHKKKYYQVDSLSAKRICAENKTWGDFILPSIDSKFLMDINNENLKFYGEALRLALTFQIYPYFYMGYAYSVFDDTKTLNNIKNFSNYLLYSKITNKFKKDEIRLWLEKINNKTIGEIKYECFY